MFKFNQTELKLLTRLNDTRNNVYVKLEGNNPSGSIKDKAVYQMLIDYKNSGKLVKGCTIIEATSGNTGISLAYFSSIFEYKCIIVMPTSMSQQRRDMIMQYGAELCLVDGGMKECNFKASELVNSISNSFVFGQFDNKSNVLGHYKITAPDLDSQLQHIDYIFAGIGTGGTITGIAKYFKEKYPDIKIIGIEPMESPLITKGVTASHLIQGIGANFIPSILDLNLIDKVVDVKGVDAIEMAKKLREVENIDIGISSGAAYLGAVSFLKENNIVGKNIVIICPDKGDRYTW